MVDKITGPITPLGEINKINEIIDNLGSDVTVDQTYNASSANAQSGVAINGAKFIQNTATGSQSYSMGGTATSTTGSTNIGYGSQCSAGNYATALGHNADGRGNSAVAIGRDATASGSFAAAIGRATTASGSMAVAIGYGAACSGGRSIQLGYGTNNTTTSLSVGFQNVGNYELLDGTTGKIPNDRIKYDGTTITVNSSGELTSTGGGSSRNIGEIVASTIPLTDSGLHLLDGALIQGSGVYSAFVTYIAGLVSTYPDLFTTEANWQSAISQYGVCGKFVYNPSTSYYAWYNTTTDSTVYTTQLTGGSADFKVFAISDGNVTEISHESARITNNVLYVNTDGAHDIAFKRASSSDTQTAPSVRLPKYSNKIFTGGGTAPVIGNGTTLGLTNGTSTTGLSGFINNNSISELGTNGNFYGKDVGTSASIAWQNNGAQYSLGVTNDSEKSGLVAQLSNITTSLDGYYYIVVATSAKTDIQVDIDEIATDLNGKADTGLSNVPTSKGILTESYKNGSSWYRVYADGWCEQGGAWGTSTGTWASANVTFLKPFVNNYYALFVQGNWNDGAYSSCKVTSRSGTGFTGTYANNLYSVMPSLWRACGYIR